MPQLNEQQLNQLKFAEDYAKNRQQEWNSLANKAMLYKWNIYGPENKENVLLLKSLLVLKDKNAITEEKLNEVSLYQDDKGKSEVEIDKRSER